MPNLANNREEYVAAWRKHVMEVHKVSFDCHQNRELSDKVADSIDEMLLQIHAAGAYLESIGTFGRIEKT